MLTGRQQEIWDFLVDYVDRHGYPPTVREIGEAVGLASPSTVHAHLANLERAGLLKRDPTKPRALELVGRERNGSTLEPIEVVMAPAERGPDFDRECAGEDLNLHGLLRPLGPQPSASTNSATSARGDASVAGGRQLP